MTKKITWHKWGKSYPDNYDPCGKLYLVCNVWEGKKSVFEACWNGSRFQWPDDDNGPVQPIPYVLAWSEMPDSPTDAELEMA